MFSGGANSIRRVLHSFAIFATAVFSSAAFAHAADAPARATWLNAKQVANRLEQPVSFAWNKNPLRSALQRLSQSLHVAIVLDRAIDPEQKIDLVVADDTLEVALGRIAAGRDMGVALIGPVVYLGPKRTAERLRTLSALRRADAAKAPEKMRTKLIASRPMKWEELSTPRELLDQLAKEAGVTIEGADQVPHDLWPATDLPAMPWTDRLSLIAAEFGETFEIGPGSNIVKLVPIPDQATIVRSYPGAGNAAALAAKLKGQIPTAKIETKGEKVVVDARAEDHDLIERARATGSAKRTTVTPSKEVYQLTFKDAPLEKVLAQLKTQLKLEIEFDDAAIRDAGILLSQPVSLDVKNANLDELLTATLKPAGLTFERHDRSIKIRPLAK